jgi:hypothetical protein
MLMSGNICVEQLALELGRLNENISNLNRELDFLNLLTRFMIQRVQQVQSRALQVNGSLVGLEDVCMSGKPQNTSGNQTKS